MNTGTIETMNEGKSWFSKKVNELMYFQLYRLKRSEDSIP